jgi:hypothetical protein
MDGKKSFVLYCSQYEPIKDLKISQKAQLFDIIFQYHIDGKVPEITDPVVKVVFGFFKQVFDIDQEKWSKKAAVNRENGKQGGRGNKAKTQKNPKKPVGLEKTESFVKEPSVKKSIPAKTSTQLIDLIKKNGLDEYSEKLLEFLDYRNEINKPLKTAVKLKGFIEKCIACLTNHIPLIDFIDNIMSQNSWYLPDPKNYNEFLPKPAAGKFPPPKTFDQQNRESSLAASQQALAYYDEQLKKEKEKKNDIETNTTGTNRIKKRG